MPDPISAEQMTRQVFRGLSHAQVAVFYAAAFLTIASLLWAVYAAVAKYRRGSQGQSEGGRRPDPWRALARVAGNVTIGRRHLLVGVAHFALFWGFLVLFAGTCILTLETDTPLHFWYGRFYLWYSLALDVLGVLFLGGLVALAVRRATRPRALSEARPAGLDAREARRARFGAENWGLLALLLVIGITGYLLEGLRLRADQPAWERAWSPVGWAAGRLLSAAGLSAAGANDAYVGSWWLHGVLSLAFVALLPYTKARHMVLDAINLGVSAPGAFAALPRLKEGEKAGYPVITSFHWKHLLSQDACIRCGRCEAACPATAAGRPLSPKQVILDLSEHATAALRPGPPWRKATGPTEPRAVPGEVIAEDTLWSCTTCGSCAETCPVGIDHVTQIVQMRRTLVEDGRLDRKVQEALMGIFEQGNALGEASGARGEWTRGLDFPVPDARTEAVDVLWWVGDVMSFDRRAQQSALALARVLHLAGVKFGILYDGERNDGNDVRRIGEEGLFEMLATSNVELLGACRFERIMTADPHALNALKNEYPQFGGSWQVLHHTELLAELIEAGRLSIAAPQRGRVTYHDPCHLSRYVGVVQPPRRVLAAAGAELAEMPRCGENTFCCGAGGGGFYREFPGDTTRPAVLRIHEAMEIRPAPQAFVVSCPMDLVMYSDAVKTAGVEKQLQVVEISELVASAVAAGALPAEPPPSRRMSA